MLSAQVLGIGVLGPGLADWDATAAILRGQIPYVAARTVLPAPLALPPPERRRAGRVVQLALAVCSQAVLDAAEAADTLPCVFSSSSGDGDNCHEICVALAGTERALSPTRFHNSVHNAPAGYWSIAHGSHAPYSALCAYDGSFGAGLIEALLQLRAGAAAVLLAAYDVDYPQPLRAQRPIPDAFGVALVLGTGAAHHMSLQLRFTEAPATPLPDPQLETLRRGCPAARALPLLQSIACRRPGGVVLDYLPERRLQLELAP